MTESAYSSNHGAEISERSTELVLPSSPAASTRAENVDPNGVFREAAANGWRTAPLSGAEPVGLSAHSDGALFDAADARVAPASSPAQAAAALVETVSFFEPAAGSFFEPAAGSADPSRSAADGEIDARDDETWSPARGQALPGDRGPRETGGGAQRPSFWRRIALGRRAQAQRNAAEASGDDGDAFHVSDRVSDAAAHESGREMGGDVAIGQALAARRALATRGSNDALARANESVERRIVEPLLQALVSVEAKLERSHVDLVGRSDQVEQRLTQLWDIEEQLGALGELQETVLQVTEQQRRLESALVAQTRILRWLVGGIILSLAVAAFAVAFFLRVSS